MLYQSLASSKEVKYLLIKNDIIFMSYYFYLFTLFTNILCLLYDIYTKLIISLHILLMEIYEEEYPIKSIIYRKTFLFLKLLLDKV